MKSPEREYRSGKMRTKTGTAEHPRRGVEVKELKKEAENWGGEGSQGLQRRTEGQEAAYRVFLTDSVINEQCSLRGNSL